jgi:hypothetical protein
MACGAARTPVRTDVICSQLQLARLDLAVSDRSLYSGLYCITPFVHAIMVNTRECTCCHAQCESHIAAEMRKCQSQVYSQCTPRVARAPRAANLLTTGCTTHLRAREADQAENRPILPPKKVLLASIYIGLTAMVLGTRRTYFYPGVQPAESAHQTRN